MLTYVGLFLECLCIPRSVLVTMVCGVDPDVECGISPSAAQKRLLRGFR
jgi:hypothetical protein